MLSRRRHTGYRWPARKSDGYANGFTYTGAVQGLEMGALLALPPSFDIDNPGNRTGENHSTVCRITAAMFATQPAGIVTIVDRMGSGALLTNLKTWDFRDDERP